MKTLTLLLALSAAALAVQDMPKPTPTAEHEWLQQLVGEWKVTAEATMEPGAEPMRTEGTESVRSLGGLWIVAEGTANWGGDPFTSLLTVGYNPDEKAFVGTWIDSMQTTLWKYRGTLNEKRTVLSLEAEGPAFDDPTRKALYRDAIEIKGKDHKTLTSSVRGEDGQWTTFMRANYHRK